MTAQPESLVDPASVDVDPHALAAVLDLFRRQHEAGAFPGGQLVVRRRGRLLLDVAVGIARGWRESERAPAVPATTQTRFPVYSAGKPLAAVVMAMLEDRGVLRVEDKVARFFPEFAQNGKGDITILDVLSHRAGVILPDLHNAHQRWSEPDFVRNALVRAAAHYPRGTFAYLPDEYGWILDEVVRSAVGKPLADVAADEIAQPLGLPELRYGLAQREPSSVARTYWLGGPRVMVAGFNVAKDFEETYNASAYFECRNPAFTMITNAASLARFYELLVAGGVAPSGQRLLSERTTRTYTTRAVAGWNHSLRTMVALGRGFFVGGWMTSAFGWWKTNRCFGHIGMFGSMGFGDHDTGVSAAIVTNGNRGFLDAARRFTPLAHAIRASCR